MSMVQHGQHHMSILATPAQRSGHGCAPLKVQVRQPTQSPKRVQAADLPQVCKVQLLQSMEAAEGCQGGDSSAGANAQLLQGSQSTHEIQADVQALVCVRAAAHAQALQVGQVAQGTQQVAVHECIGKDLEGLELLQHADRDHQLPRDVLRRYFGVRSTSL
jgi:hypothetical protein